MEFEVYVKSEPGHVEILRYTLPNGNVITNAEGPIDLRYMNSYQFSEFVLITNPNTIKQTKHLCVFFGLKKGKGGIYQMNYDVIAEIPAKKAAQ